MQKIADCWQNFCSNRWVICMYFGTTILTHFLLKYQVRLCDLYSVYTISDHTIIRSDIIFKKSNRWIDWSMSQNCIDKHTIVYDKVGYRSIDPSIWFFEYDKESHNRMIANGIQRINRWIVWCIQITQYFISLRYLFAKSSEFRIIEAGKFWFFIDD